MTVRIPELARLARRATTIAALLALWSACSTQSAFAVAPASHLTLHSVALPGVFSAADSGLVCESSLTCDAFEVTASESGSRSAGGPVVLTDALPPGLVVQGLALTLLGPTGETGGPVGSCERSAGSGRCEYPGELAPDETLQMKVYVTLEPGAVSGEAATASVFENGTLAASTSEKDLVGVALPFGPSGLTSVMSSLEGVPDTQAGGHPYEASTRIDLNTDLRNTPEGQFDATSVEDARDVVVDLPLGFIGSAVASPKCTFAQLSSQVGCPSNTVVGQILTEPELSGTQAHWFLYNVVAEQGRVAEFGFLDAERKAHVISATLAPTAAGYVVRVVAREIPQIALTSISTTFYGNPAVKDASTDTQSAMFTNPSDCDGEPPTTTLYVDSWQHPGSFNADGSPDLEGAGSSGWSSASTQSPPVTGCNQLRFNPSDFSFQPETTTADAPTGATFDLKLPQSETPGTLATPPLKDATVVLPAGLTLDPSAAGGLQSCTESQIGWRGGTLSNFTEAAPTCPEASRIGSVQVTSPLLEGTLQGSVYLAAENENPYGTLLGGYVVIDDEKTGTIVKVPGKLETNESTGQITGVFDDNPQIPFSELKIHFFGGSRGDLATPEACGTYTVNSSLEPWSAPESGPNATPSDSFAITNGCVSGFTPAFHAGTTSPQAGAFSPFTLSLGREDNEQGLGGLTVNLPTGLVGRIAGVGECSEPQVAAAQARSAPGQGAAEQASPSCPESSLVGNVTTATGPGPQPYSVSGKAYLTGPYKGAPYGLAVVVPAVAGPFDLGTVVIRQALFINPTDAHVTDVSDPFPTIRDGIPLRIKRVNVTLNRPNFTLNPTSCETKAITGTATSTTGTQTPVSSHFQAAGCASLAFKPVFKITTSGKTSRKNGASLDVKLSYPTGSFGKDANIHSVKVNLPKQLPSRLSTLQKACIDSVFNANPAACPAASRVGTATATTPILETTLTGPAYFVSHGGAKFPELIVVLSGQGITIDLHGETFISKAGITSSTFRSVPDVPVQTFELKLPQGPDSALAANGNLCTSTLTMPTAFTAQNGATIKQSTPITVTGCKPAINVLRHSANANTATIAVSVPSAGRLVASGAEIKRSVKRVAKAGTVTIGVTLTSHGLRVLAKNPHQRVNANVKLRFTPEHGAPLTAYVRLLLG
jgi:hypothetical protein